MRQIRAILPLAAACLLAACATGGPLLTGTPRAPIDPSQVRFYYDAPAGAEQIAIIDASSGAFTYGNANKTNSVMQKLREQAARLGANGVVYRGAVSAPGNSGVGIGVGGGRIGGSSYSSAGVGVNISPTQKYAEGAAIYVANPPPEDTPPPRP
jgi:hypothetical protein